MQCTADATDGHQTCDLKTHRDQEKWPLCAAKDAEGKPCESKVLRYGLRSCGERDHMEQMEKMREEAEKRLALEDRAFLDSKRRTHALGLGVGQTGGNVREGGEGGR